MIECLPESINRWGRCRPVSWWFVEVGNKLWAWSCDADTLGGCKCGAGDRWPGSVLEGRVIRWWPGPTNWSLGGLVGSDFIFKGGDGGCGGGVEDEMLTWGRLDWDIPSCDIEFVFHWKIQKLFNFFLFFLHKVKC